MGELPRAEHALVARWYDPAAGRFVSEDPLGFIAGDANFDRYVGNSPTTRTDPSGLDWYDDSWWDWVNPWTYPILRELPEYLATIDHVPDPPPEHLLDFSLTDLVEFQANLVNVGLGIVIWVADYVGSIPIQILDAVTPGDWYDFPSTYYYEGMIVTEGGLWTWSNSAITIPYFVFGPDELSDEPAWLTHEVYGHGDQEQYGFLSPCSHRDLRGTVRLQHYRRPELERLRCDRLQSI